MGLLAADKKDIQDYKLEITGKYELPLQQFKRFEFYFRQLFILKGGYEYSYDQHSKEILSTKDFIERDQQIDDYIKTWEDKTGEEYGFSKVDVEEVKLHSFYIEEYNALMNDLFYSDVSYRNELISVDIRPSWIKDLKNNLEYLISHNGSKGRGYVKYLTNDLAEIDDSKFDYYSKYIYFSKAVFSYLFKSIETANSIQKTKINEFISSKLIFEHDLESMKSVFTPEVVKNRIKGNKKKVSSLNDYLSKELNLNKRVLKHLEQNLFSKAS